MTPAVRSGQRRALSRRTQRPRHTQILPLIAGVFVELALLAWYVARAQMGHWLTHLLVGALVALLAMTFLTRRRKKLRVQSPAVWVVTAHVLASIPDLLVQAGVTPRRWMDLFLGNVSSHYAPAGNITWLVLVTAGMYVYARTAWAASSEPVGRRRHHS